MKVKGDIYVKKYDIDGALKDVLHTENTFTNVGKQQVVNWFLHDNFSEDYPTPSLLKSGGGRSLSSTKIVPYNEITWHNPNGTNDYNGGADGGVRCLHPASAYNDSYLQLYTNYTNQSWASKDFTYGTAYFEFSEVKHIVGIATAWHRSSTWTSPNVQIAVSPNSYATNSNWTVVQYTKAPYWNDQAYNNRCNVMCLYDNANKPDAECDVLKNVKTVRISCRGHAYNTWVYLYGLWFFENNFYPNNPSVIGLGTGSTASSVNDVELESEDNRGWINYTYNPSDNEVVYTRRLSPTLANDVTFREVGLFFSPINGQMHGGSNDSSIATNLFARGVFETPWSKTLGEVIDIDYKLTLS